MPIRPQQQAVEEFLTRGVSQVIVKEELERALLSGERRLRVKQGFDPTSKNLHLGHAVGLRKLRRFAEWGHEIVLIVGDWTTQIGDPTDKDVSRPMRSRDDVLANARTYLEQFHLIVPRDNTRIVFQDEWYGPFGLRDVIELASRFSVQQMLAREEFRKRQAAGTAIPIKDLLYPLLQAYDSVAIDADVELGGTDQLFNILAGRELQEELGQRPQSVFIVELLEGLDGNKMSKSIPHTGVWLTDPPGEMYGKVMSINDDLMPHWFEWGTEMPLEDVRAILGALARKELHPRDAKARLAHCIVTELHSGAAADEAAAAFDRTVRRGETPDEMPEITLRADGEQEVAIVDLLLRARLEPSRSAARRLVEQGGVRIDGTTAGLDTTVPTSGTRVVQHGRRKYTRIRWI